MNLIDLAIIIVISLFVIIYISVFVYKKYKHMPTGECACCAKKGNKLLKEYNKKYKK